MNDIEIITYSTHDEGSFKELINNKFGIKINVLGWGKSWNGFMDKFINIYDYIKARPDNKIIIFIDGFDTIINKDLETIYKRFKKLDNRIVVSKDKKVGPLLNIIVNKIFDNVNGIIVNSGMYMGYNKDLKKLLKYILDKNYSDDDQRNLNEALHHFNNFKIDTNNLLFHNLNYYERNINKLFRRMFYIYTRFFNLESYEKSSKRIWTIFLERILSYNFNNYNFSCII